MTARIINGKRYNTDTAQLIASYDNGMQGDFSWYHEALYRTPRGNWFIVGKGGGMSPYNKRCGNNCWTGATELIPVQENWVRQWLEQHRHDAALEEHFGSSIEDA